MTSVVPLVLEVSGFAQARVVAAPEQEDNSQKEGAPRVALDEVVIDSCFAFVPIQ